MTTLLNTYIDINCIDLSTVKSLHFSDPTVALIWISIIYSYKIIVTCITIEATDTLYNLNEYLAYLPNQDLIISHFYNSKSLVSLHSHYIQIVLPYIDQSGYINGYLLPLKSFSEFLNLPSSSSLPTVPSSSSLSSIPSISAGSSPPPLPPSSSLYIKIINCLVYSVSTILPWLDSIPFMSWDWLDDNIVNLPNRNTHWTYSNDYITSEARNRVVGKPNVSVIPTTNLNEDVMTITGRGGDDPPYKLIIDNYKANLVRNNSLVGLIPFITASFLVIGYYKGTKRHITRLLNHPWRFAGAIRTYLSYNMDSILPKVLVTMRNLLAILAKNASYFALSATIYLNTFSDLVIRFLQKVVSIQILLNENRLTEANNVKNSIIEIKTELIRHISNFPLYQNIHTSLTNIGINIDMRIIENFGSYRDFFVHISDIIN